MFSDIVDVAAVAIRPFLTVVVIALSAFGTGSRLLAWLNVLPETTPTTHRLYAMATGLGALALVIFGLGLLGLLYPLILGGLLVIGLAALPAALLRPSTWLSGPHMSRTRERSLLRRAGRWLLVGFLSAAAALAGFGLLMPEFFHDALIYHLELPRYALLHHRLAVLPWNYNSALPANINMLHLLALALSDERATKLVHAGLGLLCMAALIDIGSILDQWEQGRLTGWLAGALFILTPSVFVLTTVSSIDLGLTLFELLALSAWLRWQAARHDGNGDARRWLLLSALFTALSLGTKYSAWFFVFGLLGAWALELVRSPGPTRRATATALGRWLGVSFLVASPWYLRTYWETGNPFYPALAEYFGTGWLTASGTTLLHRDLGTGGIAVGAMAPYLRHLVTLDIGWVTLAAAIGGGVLAVRHRAVRSMVVVIVLSGLAWWLTAPVPRYLTPTVALLATLAALALTTAGRRHRIAGALAVVAAATALIGQLAWSARMMHDLYLAPFRIETDLPPGGTNMVQYSALQVMRDGPARQQWLAWSVPPYAAMAYANDHLPPDARVLFVGEYRGFYLERDRIIGTKYDRSPLIEWASASATPEALEQQLRTEGVTHLLYNQIEARRLERAGYPAFTWPDEESRRLFEQLRSERLVQVHVENGVFLYAINPPDKPASAHGTR